MIHRVAALVLFVLSAPLAAEASDQVSGLGVTTWSITQTSTAGTSCIKRAGGASDCILIPAGDSAEHRYRAVVVQSSGASRVCAVSDPTLAIESDLELTESGPTSTRGSCHEFPSAGGTWVFVVDRIAMIEAGSGGMARTGICSVALSTTHGERADIYAPCSANADCTSYGGGTCASSPTAKQRQGAGLFLVGRSVSGSVSVTVRKERVPR